MKKSQSAIEFVILVGAMLLFFILMSYSFQQNIIQKATAKRNLEVKSLALNIQNEIDLAHSSIEGYERTFKVPNKIINIDYNLNLTENYIYIQTEDKKIALALPTQNVTGQIQKGNNVIKKVNGGVFLN